MSLFFTQQGYANALACRGPDWPAAASISIGFLKNSREIYLKTLKVAVAAAAMFSASMMPTTASARDFGAIYIECGLGGLLVPKTPWAAVLTNIIWDLGTTAITSELTTPESCKGGQAKTAALIYQTLPSLEREIAAGGGAHVDALMATGNCATESQAAVTAELRQNFGTVVGRASYSTQSREQKAEALYNAFTTSAAQSCTIG